jgi:hypothetical protein
MSVRNRRRLPVLLVLLLSPILMTRHAVAASGEPLASSGGAVLSSSTTYAIFWLPGGTHYEPSGSDAAYETLIQQFLTDVGGTPFYSIVTQYPDGSNAYPTTRSTFAGSYVDTTPYPQAGTATNPLEDADIQAAVSRAMTSQGWRPSPTALFFVYVGSGVQSCFDGPSGQCSTDNYCVAHAWFVPNGSSQPVVYATMPDAGNNGGACLAQGGSGAYANNDALADSEISLTSRELLAMVTDPQGDGWSDPTGAELGDKCDWDFGSVAFDGSNVTFGTNHKYLVQREWSNAANGCALSYASRTSRTGGSGSPAPVGNRANRGTPVPTASGAATATPTAVPNQANRRTPTPMVVGPPTATPTPVAGQSNRLTPVATATPTPTPTSVSTPTPVPGRSHRPRS